MAGEPPSPVRDSIAQRYRLPVPAKQIKSISIVPVDGSAEGGDVLIDYAEGLSHRLSTAARRKLRSSPRMADARFNPWPTTSIQRAICGSSDEGDRALQQRKRVAIIEPENKQRSVAFRNGSSAIMVSAQGTAWADSSGVIRRSHGARRPARHWSSTKAPSRSGCRGSAWYCCTVKTTVTTHTR